MDNYATPEIARVMQYAHEVLPDLEAAAPGHPTLAGLLAVGLGALREVYLCPVCGTGVYRAASCHRSRASSAWGAHSAVACGIACRMRQRHRSGKLSGQSDRTMHIDHVIPISHGGANHPDNLVTACETCNLSKHSKTPEQWLS